MQIPGSQIRRLALVAACLAAAGLALTGCTKPYPAISVFSGSSSVNTEAICWAADSDSLSPTQCAADVVKNGSGKAPRISVLPGSTIGISVDPVIAESGWTPVINGQRLVETPLTQNYYRFTYPSLNEIPADGLELVIQAGQNTKTRGIWVVKVTK